MNTCIFVIQYMRVAAAHFGAQNKPHAYIALSIFFWMDFVFVRVHVCVPRRLSPVMALASGHYTHSESLRR